MSKEADIGYGSPPKSGRFKKGQSGNPKGRPRNQHCEIPYDVVLGQKVTILEDGKKRRVTAAEAFLLQLTQKGLAGDSAASHAALETIEEARGKQIDERNKVDKITMVPIRSGADVILDKLGIAIKKYPADPKRVRWELNPWIVEGALARLGDEQLSEDDQRVVWNATRTPHKVSWPDGTDIDASNSQGHHIERHADGGPTTPDNHAEVCTDCHKELHSPD